MTTITPLSAQVTPAFFKIPDLPDDKGFAGMYAGTSNGSLFCMGGANFPGKMPWEGGKKKWYDGIYMLREGGKWMKLKQKLSSSAGYGVSVSYNETIIIAGGCNEKGYFKNVFGYTWTGDSLACKEYPALPIAISFMSGALVNNLLVIAGGNLPGDSSFLNNCYALDLENISAGWMELDPCPGPGRSSPIGAAFNGEFYIFSGEAVGLNAANQKFPLVLQDAYRLKLSHAAGKWTGKWTTLAPMPKGMAAGPAPVPVLKNGTMLFWGGVDAVSRLHKNPATYPGIPEDVLIYDPVADLWESAGKEQKIASRVTLPAVHWNGQWVFISGELRPGVRTNAVTALKDKQ